MSAADLGQKRRCNACGMKFYDFKKSPITCPSCNAEFDPDSLLKSRLADRASAKQEEKAPSKADDSNDELLEENSDEFDDDDNFEDDDTLPSDDDGLIIKWR